MKVLIVGKTTNYELHGRTVEQKASRGAVPLDVLTRLKTAHAEHYATADALKSCLDREGIAFKEISRLEDMPNESFDLVISVGGDGTLLAASHKLEAGGKIIGIRSSRSSVGFLCAISEDGIPELARRIKSGTIKSLAVTRIAAEITWADSGEPTKTAPIMNDFLFANRSPAATTRYKIRYGGKEEAQRSSGVWIATGIGSTAAIFAAGGERRDATDPLVQFRVRELYMLGLTIPEISHGFFDPGKDVFAIENRCEHAILAVDGQHGGHDLGYGDTVRFVPAPPIDLIRSL